MEKFFRAAVVDGGFRLPGSDAAPDVLPVLVSDVVGWEVEFRCFIKDRRRAAMSPYLSNGELARTDDGEWVADEGHVDEAVRFLDSLLHEPTVPLPPAVVVDVGKLCDGSWAVVEANPAWGSGIYGCDPDRVLDVVRRSCVKTGRIAPEDEPWVIDHAQEDFT